MGRTELTTKWVQYGAFAAVLAGVAFVAESAVFLLSGEGSLVDAFLLAGYALMALGLVGFHALQKNHYGRIGRAGFYAAIAGSMTMVVAVGGTLAGMDLEILHIVGFLVTIAGWVLYGVATWRAGVLPRWTGVAFVLLGPVSLAVPGDYSTGIVGLIWLALGYTLYSKRGGTITETSTTNDSETQAG